MKRVRVWQEEAGIISGHLFRRVSQGLRYSQTVGSNPLSTEAIRQIVKKRAEKAGKTEGISGHSLRVGSAQSLARAGSSLVEMQQASCWQSPEMPARYARKELAGHGAIARLRYGK